MIQTNIQEKNRDKENLVVQNLALSIQDEVALATEASEGYARYFSVPQSILGKTYDIEIIDNHIYVKTNRKKIANLMATLSIYLILNVDWMIWI